MAKMCWQVSAGENRGSWTFDPFFVMWVCDQFELKQGVNHRYGLPQACHERGLFCSALMPPSPLPPLVAVSLSLKGEVRYCLPIMWLRRQLLLLLSPLSNKDGYYITVRLHPRSAPHQGVYNGACKQCTISILGVQILQRREFCCFQKHSQSNDEAGLS